VVSLRGGAQADKAQEAQEEAEDERFSYIKQAELEMKRAEEKAAARSKEYEEYMERRKKGEQKAEYEEVRDTLRWGNDDDKGKKDGKLNKKERGRPPAEKARRHEEANEGSGRRKDDIVLEHEVKEGGGRRNVAVQSLEPEVEEEEAEELNEVEEWLMSHGLPQYAKVFEEEGWDTLDSVYTMTEADMVDLGIKKGHVRKLMLAMGREPTIMESVPRNMRGVSYARGRPAPSQMRGYQEPWAEPPAHASDDYERRDGGSGLHTSVRTRYGPGGSSKLADAGGLGAFMMGGDEDEDDYVPGHRRLQARKEQGR